VAHAASLGQGCPHCRRSSTAATRRCLASVSVPVARVVLSHPLGVCGSVGRHPTDYLIPRGPRPGRTSLCSPEVIRYYPPSRTAIPGPGVGTHALLPLTPVPPLRGFPRLACLIHAANVRSEPGSNPSKVSAYPWAAARGPVSGVGPCGRSPVREPVKESAGRLTAT